MTSTETQLLADLLQNERQTLLDICYALNDFGTSQKPERTDLISIARQLKDCA